METVVTAELAHILGMTSDGGSRFQFGGFNTQLTNTGTTCSGPGDLWQFTGANGTHLMTSNNGGGADPTSECPCTPRALCVVRRPGRRRRLGQRVVRDLRRYLPPNVLGLMFHDVFNMDINMPEDFGTFYSTLNKSTGNLLVRGGDDNDASNDVINVTRSGGEIAVSVDIGNDVPATGPTDAFVSHYTVGDVQSITVNALDGDDSITVEPGLGIAVTANGGNGNDTIVGGVGDDTLNGGAGNDQIFAGAGNNTVIDGTGNDFVDLTENSAPVNYVTRRRQRHGSRHRVQRQPHGLDRRRPARGPERERHPRRESGQRQAARPGGLGQHRLEQRRRVRRHRGRSRRQRPPAGQRIGGRGQLRR